MLAKLSLIVLLEMVAVIQASGQCHVDTHRLLADARTRPGSPEILSGFEGEIYLLLPRSGSDTLSNGAESDARGHFLMKYDADHELLWWRDIRSWGTNIEMALDSNGRILLTGVGGVIDGDSLASDQAPFIARLNDDGSIDTVISVRNARVLNNQRKEGGLAVSREHIYYVGRQVDSNRMIIVQMDYEGNTLWTRHAEIGRYGYDMIDFIDDVGVDADGNVYISGEYQVEVIFGRDTLRSNPRLIGTGGIAFFIASWSADGRYRWGLNRIRMEGNDVGNWSNQFLLLHDGHLYVTAHDPDYARFANGPDTLPVGPLFLAKVSLEGELHWVRSYKFSTAGADDRDLDIEAGVSGEVILSATSPPSGRGVFRYGDNDSVRVGARDQLIVRYDRDGNVICATTLAESFWTDIATDRTGGVFIAGIFGDSIVFNQTDTVRSGAFPRWSIYIAQLGARSVRAPGESPATTSFEVYPNPASGTMTLVLPEAAPGSVDVRLGDMLGTVVYNARHEPTGGMTLQIPVEALPSGIYHIQVIGNRKVYQERIVIAR